MTPFRLRAITELTYRQHETDAAWIGKSLNPPLTSDYGHMSMWESLPSVAMPTPWAAQSTVNEAIQSSAFVDPQ